MARKERPHGQSRPVREPEIVGLKVVFNDSYQKAVADAARLVHFFAPHISIATAGDYFLRFWYRISQSPKFEFTLAVWERDYNRLFGFNWASRATVTRFTPKLVLPPKPFDFDALFEPQATTDPSE